MTGVSGGAGAPRSASVDRRGRQSLPARMVHRLVRGYQHLTAGRPSPCRYVPTCSSYALDAVEQHGAARGSWLAVRRLARCHPWSRHSGWDPVPPPRQEGV